MRIAIEEIRKLCINVLLKKGLGKEDSGIIVKEFLYGELTGKKSHGFAAFSKFASRGDLVGKEDWKILNEDENYALIGANKNLGQLVGKFAMDLAIKKAKKKGIALVGMNNMFTYMTPGYYAKMASDQRMIGVVINNAPSTVAPFGGIDPKLGTNPVAIGIPIGEIPLVLDMATATRAMGEVRLAEKMGEVLPENMAVDKEGKLTTDPKKAYALTTFGGYKGYGLCLAIEILAGSFVRAKMGGDVKNSFGRGYLFLVINPEIFVNIETFQKEASQLVKEVKSSKKVKGMDEILIPGERAGKLMKQNMDNGYLEIDDKIIGEIKGLL